MKPPTYTLAFWTGLFLFSIYLLTFSGKLHVMDEFVGFAVGNNWVQHGRPDVNQFIWTNHWHSTPPGVWGADGNLYTKKAPGISLAAAPLIWLGHTLPGLNAVHLGLLTSMIIIAITGGVLFIWLVELKISWPVALLTALAYGLCTMALVYARLLWEHSIIAFVFLSGVWTVYKISHSTESRRRWAWLMGCSLSMAVALTMRFEALFAVALFGVCLFLLTRPLPAQLSAKNFWTLLQDTTRWGWLMLYSILPFFTLLWLLYFNAARFGSISETGYNREILFQRPWVGMYGLLLSPSTGLFIYAPLTLLIFFGLRPARRRLPGAYFWLIIGLCLFYWAFYGSWFSWGSTWVWGPRFMLHTLPLLMLFVAETVEWITHRPNRWPLWVGVVLLALAGFFINFLGVVVDLNEHFLRLGRNDDFVFNWQAFPPLGHWQILQEGLTDIIWLRGTGVEWSILFPALVLSIVALMGLIIAHSNAFQLPLRITHHASRFILSSYPIILTLLTATVLLYQMMTATAHISLANDQAQADAVVIDALTASARPTDSLFIAMPPFGDAQEITTYVMAYLDEPLPTYAWIETEPRAIQPNERERVWQAALSQSNRVWLFERWLSPDDPLSETALRFNRQAFPVQEQWIEQSGKLTLFALPPPKQTAQSIPLNASFQAGLTLVDFTVLNPTAAPGDILKVRLTWQAADDIPAATSFQVEGGVISFAHLVNTASAQNVAQNDRLLLNWQQLRQSPLLPGQSITQGYGLALPQDLPPGSYPLIAGLYLGDTGQRLPRADNSPDDFLYLMDIVVQ
jgi:hypothetical protein